jgi:DNA-binding beta-propeller fold protein YncE
LNPAARFAVALATLVSLLGPAPRALAARAYVVESDFASGSCAGVDVASRQAACNVSPVHSDARVRWYDGRIYIVNRFGADNIQVLHGTTYALLRQFSVGNGSNPYDIAFASPTKAYVTRWATSELWIVNPATGAHTGTISLASLADDDGKPEMDRLMMVGPLLFVSLQRIDQAGGFQPTDSSLVAVVDTRTDALVDCDPTVPGAQGILLPRVNPVTSFVFDEPRTRLYLGCVGRYGELDGGIVAIDPAALVATGVVAREDSLQGDVLDLAWAGEQRAFAIVSDASFNTELIRWSPVSGDREGTLYSPGGFSLADAEVTPAGDEVWVCNSSFASPGLRVFSAYTGLPLAGPITCTLPPQGITFDHATGQVAGVEPPATLPGLALAPPWPNPARDAVRLEVVFPSPLVGQGGGAASGGGALAIEVMDATGRRVREWRFPTAATARRVIAWDLADARGRRVAPGLYLVTARIGERVAAKKVLVLR